MDKLVDLVCVICMGILAICGTVFTVAVVGDYIGLW